MSNSKEHVGFAKHCEAMSEHHATILGALDDLEKCLGKAETPEAKAALHKMKAGHSAAIAEYDGRAEHHHEQAGHARKAEETDDDLSKRLEANRIMPTYVSGIAPERTGIHPVPRAGQPSPAVAKADPQFEFLTKVEDGQDELPLR